MKTLPLLLGHRGAMGIAPENSLAGFQKALELGLNGVELDVRLCKSGELVVIHDNTLDRTTNGTGKIIEQSKAYLDTLRISDPIYPTSQMHQIPTLEAVLDQFPPGFKVDIELKERHTVEPLIRLLESRQNQNPSVFEDYLVTSFDHPALVVLKKACPRIRIGIATVAVLVDHLEYARKLECDCLVMADEFLSQNQIEQAQSAGIEVWGFTPGEVSILKQFRQWGIDAIITDYPDTAKAILCT